MPKLTDLLDAGHVAIDVQAEDVEHLLRQLVALLVEHDQLSSSCGRLLSDALSRRERLGYTCIGHGVAVPHAYIGEVPRPILLLARLAVPIAYGEPPDGRPVDLIFMLTGPESARGNHMRVLARLVRLLHDETWLAELRRASSVSAVLDAVREVERRHG
jgi:mannitol/fructose-specific phosphotransferase system IIA component (Ntr-type)